ncbi:MAG: tetratricopeptide repeat protein [Desulfobacteraceae bacterium]|nr:tetratricopeptide repeat protein [Desulfobacteraceae bacterium]
MELEADLEEPLFELANIYERQGKAEKTVKTYKEILASDPDNIRANLGLGSFYHKKGRFRESDAIFRQLGIRSQSETDVLRLIIQQYVEQKDYKTAVILLEGMLKGVPDSSDIHYIVGVAYEGLNNSEKTIAHLKKYCRVPDFSTMPLLIFLFCISNREILKKGFAF